MSQHDMDIANQAGAAFRADLNGALQAIATNHSGSAAPTTTYAYQFWADSNAGLLRMRNGANTAWVTIGLLGVQNLGIVLPGTIVFHAKNAAPSGYLKANGGAVSRAVYADLWNEISTTFGPGDGSTTFNLPELRGEVIRAWDDGRGVDSGRTFGSAQVQNLPSFQKRLPFGFDSSSFYGWQDVSGNPQYGSEVISSANRTIVTGTSGNSNSRIGYTESANINITGELRMRNVALLACIKY